MTSDEPATPVTVTLPAGREQEIHVALRAALAIYLENVEDGPAEEAALVATAAVLKVLAAPVASEDVDAVRARHKLADKARVDTSDAAVDVLARDSIATVSRELLWGQHHDLDPQDWRRVSDRVDGILYGLQPLPEQVEPARALLKGMSLERGTARAEREAQSSVPVDPETTQPARGVLEVDGDAGAWYVRILDDDVHHTTEQAPDILNIDWTRDGRMVGIEILPSLSAGATQDGDQT